MTPRSRAQEQFAVEAHRLFGLDLSSRNADQIWAILGRAAERTGASVLEYVARLQRHQVGPEELRLLADDLAVTETHFFRDSAQFAALGERVLPALIRARADSRVLRILSAGCATGEEPYSIAMTLRASGFDLRGWQIQILGGDASAAALSRAREATYGEWSLRAVPPGVRSRWFVASPNGWRVRDEIRSMVEFRQFNLADDRGVLGPPRRYDLVFCRNVLIYFSKDVVPRVIARIEASLAPDGHLFLGHAETLRGMRTGLRVRNVGNAFFYLGAGEGAGTHAGTRAETPPAPLRDSRRTERAARPTAFVHAERVIEAARDSAQRAFDTASRGFRRAGSIEAPRSAAAEAHGVTAPPLTVYARLCEEERFAEALSLLEQSPEPRDTAGTWVRVALLAHLGRTGEARELCEVLLRASSPQPEALYLAGIQAREEDPLAAAEHFEAAATADPHFALPFVQLSLISRSCGDDDAASRYAAQALSLLPNDRERCAILHGALGSHALARVCERELSSGRSPR